MDNLKSIVVLIDADNTQLSKLEIVMREVSARGRIVVKRAYGNWRKEALKNWEDELKRLAIKAEQQFDFVHGKNATDMALTIDAMKLLHTAHYDAFVIVSSDSDFTPLAIELHESGAFVIGVGEKKTPTSFKNSCDEFILMENLGGAKTSGGNSGSDGEALEEDSDSSDLDELHSLLKLASDKYQDEEGYVNVSSVGDFLRRAKPDFDVRSYGFSKISKLIGAFPERYEMKWDSKNGASPVAIYRCKE